MRLEQLSYLVEVNNTHSISLAAENLFVTQPTLSIAISNLEKELGVKLLKRTKSGIFPTPHGLLAIQLAEDILDKMDKLALINTALASEDQVNVVTIPSINCGLLQSTLIKLNAQYPNLHVRIQEEKPSIALSLFVREYAKNMTTHIGVLSISSKLILKQKEWFNTNHFVIEPLINDEMVCMMSADNPLAEYASITWQDCANVPLIKYQYAPDNSLDYLKDPFSTIGTISIFDDLYDKNEVLLSVSTLESLKRLIAETMGISIMPSAILYNDPAFLDGRIQMRRFSDLTMPLEYHLIYSSLQPLSINEINFINTLRAVFSDAAATLALTSVDK